MKLVDLLAMNQTDYTAPGKAYARAGATPGPWSYFQGGDGPHGLLFASTVYRDSRPVALLPARADEHGACANARLIAAAPVMLEALIYTERQLTLDPDDARTDELIRQLRALIVAVTVGHKCELI